MSGMSGIELCQELRQRHPDLLPIVLTGQGGLETAIAAIRAGAYDFITKPVKVDALAIAVGRALEHLSLKREVKRLRSAADRDVPIDGIVGNSPAIRETIEMIRRVADSDATVLITGETGTGKELVARALHNLSPRRDQPFVAVNCAAMPAPLLESELFGHVRGAFTDAKRSRAGLFVQAGRRHDLPRRDRRDADRDAGQAAARPPGAQGAPGRRRRGGAVRGARRSPRPTAISRPRSRRSGSARICSIASTSSRSRCRRCARAPATSCCSRSTSCKRIAGAHQQAGAGHLAARGAPADRLRLAGQRPRARELHGARGRAVPARRDHGRRPAREDPGAPELARSSSRPSRRAS